MFRLLGPLEVTAGGEKVPVGGPRRRVVLAMLLLELRRVVPVERLIDAVWGDEPPSTARSQVQILVSELRRLLTRWAAADAIVTDTAGYSLRVPDEALDIARFRALVASGREEIRQRDPVRGTADLRAALDLWRGDAATGIDSHLVQAAVVRLNEERLTVQEECIEQELELRRHHTVIGELQELIAAHPLREKLYAHLMLALYRSGRQAEALAAYRRAHQLLVAEHGIDPADELRTLERAILDNDPALELPAMAHERIVPRQLPTASSDFVGRDETLGQARACLAPADGNGPAAVGVEVLVITGQGGVGKTTLAVYAAHSVREQFPDGQLFAHLRGADSRPVDPEAVLEQFLRALGVLPAMVPTRAREMAALYRSRLAGRRVLVVLDDAVRAGQVLPLVPGESGCKLVVTSRNALPGLPGARRFALGPLEPDTSVALLARIVGERRVQMEAQPAASLAESCGHLPLALRIAAAKLSVRQHRPIASMASRLRDERQRLDELTLDGVGVRASILLSYQDLDRSGRQLLRMLGTLGAAEFADWVASPLLDAPVREAIEILDQLVDAHLVEVTVDAIGHPRYRLHDLVRIFVQEALARETQPAARAEAQRRLLRCWLFLAREAHRREVGGDFTVLRSGAEPWPLPSDFVDELMADPIAWSQSERDNLVAAVNLAGQLHCDELCWELAMTSVTFFEARADRVAWRDTHEVALDAVHSAGNQRGEAAIRYSRGALAIVEQRLADAVRDFEPALAWFDGAGDAHGRGLTLRNLAFVDRLQGRMDEAFDRYSSALVDLRSVGDLVAEAHVFSSLAQIHMDRDRYPEAEKMLRGALEICDRVGVRRVVAQVRHRLGQLHLGQGSFGQAESEFTEVLRAVTGVGDPIGRAYALLGVGAVRLAQGDLDPARAALREALETMLPTGHQLGVGRILLSMVELSLRRGDRSAAREQLDEAERLLAGSSVSALQPQVEALRDRLRTARRRAPQS